MNPLEILQALLASIPALAGAVVWGFLAVLCWERAPKWMALTFGANALRLVVQGLLGGMLMRGLAVREYAVWMNGLSVPFALIGLAAWVALVFLGLRFARAHDALEAWRRAGES